jgi:hypothetical protein
MRIVVAVFVLWPVDIERSTASLGAKSLGHQNAWLVPETTGRSLSKQMFSSFVLYLLVTGWLARARNSPSATVFIFIYPP